MTNMILRLQLIALLQAANRVDILDRIAEPGELLSKQKYIVLMAPGQKDFTRGIC